jgi:hypothetical protein
MSDSKGSLQWEGGADDNLSPGQFLREIDNKIDERGYTTERQSVNCMRNNIAFGSAADEWFGNLKADEKDTYDHLVAAFELQWPLTAVPKASKGERIQALKEWTLKAEDIGKKVEGPGGGQIWSHVKWATGLASRVRDAEDTSAFLITDVYNALPRPVRELIRKEPRATYAELATAVLALETGELKEAAADFARDEETARLAREPASPTKAIRDALVTTHLQTPQPQYRTPAPNGYNTVTQPPTPLNPFAGTGGRGNLFGAARGNSIFQPRGSGPGALGIGRGTGRPPTPLRDRPVSVRHQDLVRYTLPHHPNTPDGHRAYQAQLVAWHTANPNSKPDEQHPYPLTPGTPAAGSRECWDCGQQDHRQRAPVCAGTTLPEPERDWRRIAGFIVSTFNRERLAAGSQNVNYISYSQYTPYPDYAHYRAGTYEGEVDDGQGNDQGSSA